MSEYKDGEIGPITKAMCRIFLYGEKFVIAETAAKVEELERRIERIERLLSHNGGNA